MPDDVNGDDEIWAGTVGDNWTFTLPAGVDIVPRTPFQTDDMMKSYFEYSSLDSCSALTIEMLYDTMYKMTGDPRYKREEKCKVIFEDVITTLP